MAKTLDDLEQLLTARGYPCKRIFDLCLLTQVPTKAYTSLRTGTKSIEVQLAFDDRNRCLTIDTPWAFDCRKAAHKEAMLACLLAASGKSPLVKTQLDPEQGEVRLRPRRRRRRWRRRDPDARPDSRVRRSVVSPHQGRDGEGLLRRRRIPAVAARREAGVGGEAVRRNQPDRGAPAAAPPQGSARAVGRGRALGELRLRASHGSAPPHPA